jgi:hypothetical protein
MIPHHYDADLKIIWKNGKPYFTKICLREQRVGVGWGRLLGWWFQNAPAATIRHSHKPASPPILTPFAAGRRPRRPKARGILPPAGNQIRRRHHPTKGRESPRRELDPPEAPCQANRKEGAGHYAPPARPLGAVPQWSQPPNQALSNHTMRLRLSPKQKNRAQAVQAALGERPPSD